MGANSGDFLDDSGRLIQFKIHGAGFEIDTGECMMGPCDSEDPEELRVKVRADG